MTATLPEWVSQADIDDAIRAFETYDSKKLSLHNWRTMIVCMRVYRDSRKEIPQEKPSHYDIFHAIMRSIRRVDEELKMLAESGKAPEQHRYHRGIKVGLEEAMHHMMMPEVPRVSGL